MRGRPVLRGAYAPWRGLTPANAGTTSSKNRSKDWCLAHPRECGDDHRGGGRHEQELGSPPRMRGRRANRQRQVLKARLTPANAGTTWLARPKTVGAAAHPRECGDDGFRHLRQTPIRGSPPRMRGRQTAREEWDYLRRLTPANAGTTDSSRRLNSALRAHPRECGDDGSQELDADGCPGSPPRMRGRPGVTPISLPPRWLTPANAGTTPCGLRRLVEPELEFYHFLALRSRAALLHPARMVGRGGCSLGLRISVIPSKSTGSQSCLWTRKSRP